MQSMHERSRRTPRAAQDPTSRLTHPCPLASMKHVLGIGNCSKEKLRAFYDFYVPASFFVVCLLI